MFKKRIISALAASATALSLTAFPASAEDGMMGLISTTTKEIDIGRLADIGGDIFMYCNEDGFGKGFFKIGVDELNEWRESGEFAIKYLETDLNFETINISWFSDWKFTEEGNYSVLPEYIDGERANTIIVRYDEENEYISVLDSYNVWTGITSDGYIITENSDNEKITVRIQAQDGDIRETTYSTYDGHRSAVMPIGDKYLYYYYVPTDSAPLIVGENVYDDITNYHMGLYGVDKAGNATELYDNWTYSWGITGWGDNYCMIAYDTDPRAHWIYVYLSDSDQMLNLNDIYLTVYYQGRFVKSPITSLGDRIYGTKAIVYAESRAPSDDWYGAYGLFDLSTSELLGEQYKYMSTYDGEIFLVQDNEWTSEHEDYDSKWGFIDAEGNKLGMFDDAGAFIGDYAPVIQNGKAYLIDRNMNRVSEMIDADVVYTFGSELFCYEKDGERYLMTFTSAQTADPIPEEPDDKMEDKPVTVPDDTEDEPEVIPADTTDKTSADASENDRDDITAAASENTAEDKPAENTAPTYTSDPEKGNPDTGIAASVIPLLIVGMGAAVLVRRKK